MSSSSFYHHFAVLYARREEERLADELAARLRERAGRGARYLGQEPADALERLEEKPGWHGVDRTAQ